MRSALIMTLYYLIAVACVALLPGVFYVLKVCCNREDARNRVAPLSQTEPNRDPSSRSASHQVVLQQPATQTNDVYSHTTDVIVHAIDETATAAENTDVTTETSGEEIPDEFAV